MYDPFHFVDIYSTKGVEYLWVLVFLALFACFSVYLRRIGVFGKGLKTLQWLRERLFHPGHTWVKGTKEGYVLVGIDDFAARLLGSLEGVILPPKGKFLRQGDIAWRLVVDGKEIPMPSPIDGRVLETNPLIQEKPNLLLEDPQGKGWIAKLAPLRVEADVRNLLDGEAVRNWTRLQLESLLGPSEALGQVAQDGGTIMPGILRKLHPKEWDRLAMRFFNVDHSLQ